MFIIKGQRSWFLDKPLYLTVVSFATTFSGRAKTTLRQAKLDTENKTQFPQDVIYRLLICCRVHTQKRNKQLKYTVVAYNRVILPGLLIFLTSIVGRSIGWIQPQQPHPNIDTSTMTAIVSLRPQLLKINLPIIWGPLKPAGFIPRYPQDETTGSWEIIIAHDNVIYQPIKHINIPWVDINVPLSNNIIYGLINHIIMRLSIYGSLSQP